MASDRLKRVNELLKREVAGILFRVMNEEGNDLAEMTVTRVRTSPDLRRATVMVSITGEPDHRRDVLAHIKRHRKEVQHQVGRNIKLKYTPRLSFELDGSLESGDHVLEIIREMEEKGQASEVSGQPSDISQPRTDY